MGILSIFTSMFKSKQKTASLTGGFGDDGFVSKELFYDILDLDHSIIMFFTKEDGWIGANKEFFEIFDYKNIEGFRKDKESIRELFDSESEEVFTEYDKSWLDYIKSQRKDGYEVTIINRKKEYRSFRVKCRMLKQRGKELYILELEDISELVYAKKKTKEVENLKSKFLANISHEFRTPMNGILGFIDILEKTNPTEDQKLHLGMAHTSARNLMSNIESLLDLAQMQGGRLKVSNSEFNPVFEFEELSRIYMSEGINKGISVSFFIDPKLPDQIVGDLRKVKQILNNLVSNALKFTKRGGKVSVEIKLLKRQLSGVCSLGFNVKDNGKGIAKEQLSLITQPFVSGDQADSRLGVGLTVSHGLIQLLDGELKVQSEEGRGSTFTFALSFDASNKQAMEMIEGKRVKVALLDEKRIEEANQLTLYLRSFAINVTKVHLIDENIYADTDMLYLVASQDQSSWLMKLGTFPKKCKTTLLLDSGEKLQTRMSKIVDFTVQKPLLPSTFYTHLNSVFNIPQPQSKIDIMKTAQLRALVAEDNLINQRLIKLLLQEYDINVVTASDGNEAVDRCIDHEFDIVFMDIDMPHKDGISATQEIKEIRSRNNAKVMPIIALTALAMDGDREHILEEGLDDYLSKPLTREKLEHILEKYIKAST